MCVVYSIHTYICMCVVTILAMQHTRTPLLAHARSSSSLTVIYRSDIYNVYVCTHVYICLFAYIQHIFSLHMNVFTKHGKYIHTTRFNIMLTAYTRQCLNTARAYTSMAICCNVVKHTHSWNARYVVLIYILKVHTDRTRSGWMWSLEIHYTHVYELCYVAWFA